jgi:hypothetical protein
MIACEGAGRAPAHGSVVGFPGRYVVAPPQELPAPAVQP